MVWKFVTGLVREIISLVTSAKFEVRTHERGWHPKA